MLRTRRRQVLAALAALVLIGLGLWGYVASRPARPAAPRVVLPIRTDTGWGVIDAATGAIIIPPTYPEPVAIIPFPIVVRRDGVLYGDSLDSRLRKDQTLDDVIMRPGSYEPIFLRRTQPPVSVVVAQGERREFGLRDTLPFVTFDLNPRAKAYTVNGELIATASEIAATHEFLAINGKKALRLLRTADLQPVPPGTWSGAADLGIIRCVFGNMGPNRTLIGLYGLDGQPCFGAEVNQVYGELFAEPGQFFMIAGRTSPDAGSDVLAALRERLGTTWERAKDAYGIPRLLADQETKSTGITLSFLEEGIQNATVYWQTPDGMRVVPGPPFDLAWQERGGSIRAPRGIIRALRGSALYELQQGQAPRRVGDLADPLALPSLSDKVTYDMSATDTQPARLIAKTACYVREADGSLQQIGPTAGPGEAFAAFYRSPNCLHLLLELQQESGEPLFHLDTYDLDGAFVSRTVLRTHCFVWPDFIETWVFSSRGSRDTTGLLLGYVDDPVGLPFKVIASLDDPGSPARRLVVRRDGKTYVADANGTRILDLPDDTINLVGGPYDDSDEDGQSPWPKSSWTLQTPTENCLLDRDGRCMARLPRSASPATPNPPAGDLVAQWGGAPFSMIGSLFLTNVDGGYRVLDSQQRDFTGRTWRNLVVINGNILALIDIDELRYIRLADATTIWSGKGSFGEPTEDEEDEVLTPPSDNAEFGQGDDDD